MMNKKPKHSFSGDFNTKKPPVDVTEKLLTGHTFFHKERTTGRAADLLETAQEVHYELDRCAGAGWAAEVLSGRCNGGAGAVGHKAVGMVAI